MSGIPVELNQPSSRGHPDCYCLQTVPVSPHVVLLGDSIFDNAAYTRGEPDVVADLRQVLPSSWRATLAAVDGASVRDLAAKLCVSSRGRNAD